MISTINDIADKTFDYVIAGGGVRFSAGYLVSN
jgi:hypothetical protein